MPWTWLPPTRSDHPEPHPRPGIAIPLTKGTVAPPGASLAIDGQKQCQMSGTVPQCLGKQQAELRGQSQ